MRWACLIPNKRCPGQSRPWKGVIRNCLKTHANPGWGFTEISPLLFKSVLFLTAHQEASPGSSPSPSSKPLQVVPLGRSLPHPILQAGARITVGRSAQSGPTPLAEGLAPMFPLLPAFRQLSFQFLCDSSPWTQVNLLRAEPPYLLLHQWHEWCHRAVARPHGPWEDYPHGEQESWPGQKGSSGNSTRISHFVNGLTHVCTEYVTSHSMLI